MIAQGFPKLAIWHGPLANLPIYRGISDIRLPKSHRSHYAMNRYYLTKGELIFLVKQYGPFRDWTTNRHFLCYYSVPLKAIEQGLIPATAVYNWKTSYNVLPTLIDEELIILSPEYVTNWMNNDRKKSTKTDTTK